MCHLSVTLNPLLFKHSSFKLALIAMVILTSLQADVIGTPHIRFDVNGDGTAEMLLNSNGLGIGTSNGLSTLEVHGSLGFGFENISSNTTLSSNAIVFADTSADNLTLTLPDTATVTGRVYYIKKTNNSNQLLITSNDLIDGEISALEMTASTKGTPFLQVMSDGTAWHTMNRSDDAQTVMASDNLIGWWKLDETSGSTVLDHSPHHNHSSITNMTFSSNSTTAVLERGLEFGANGASYIQLANTASLGTVYQGDFSLSSWYRPAVVPPGTGADPNARQGILLLRGYHVGLSYANTQKFAFDQWLDNGGVQGLAVNSTNAFSIQKFYHVVGTFDFSASQVKIYVNGVLEGTSTYGTPGTSVRVNTEKWRIGLGNTAGSAYAWPAHGIIDDVRIYNLVLTSAQVLSIYKQGL